MFDIGWSEMAVILLVALIVIGPKDLPRVARTIGKWTAKARGMAREFQRSLEDMAREAELQDVKSEIEKPAGPTSARPIEKTIDPTGELRPRRSTPTPSGRRAEDRPATHAPIGRAGRREPRGADAGSRSRTAAGAGRPRAEPASAAAPARPAPPSACARAAHRRTGGPRPRRPTRDRAGRSELMAHHQGHRRAARCRCSII